MRELELLADYLVRLRQERLQLAHSLALSTDPRILAIKAHAHEAEICERILKATRVLADDPGKFIKEYLSERD